MDGRSFGTIACVVLKIPALGRVAGFAVEAGLAAGVTMLGATRGTCDCAAGAALPVHWSLAATGAGCGATTGEELAGNVVDELGGLVGDGVSGAVGAEIVIGGAGAGTAGE